MATSVSVKIKMYRVGELGDCFLLTFNQDNHRSHVLIDCGSFRNGDDSKKRIKEVVDDIKDTIKPDKLNLVVGTHQHNDHVSGFVHCKQDFTNIIDQVWLSWLDNPRSPVAREIGDEHGNLRNNIAEISKALKGIKGNTAAKKISVQLNDILGFYGANAAPQLPAEGIRNLKSFGANDCEYKNPGDVEDVPGITGGSVKVYVLGPPRDKKLLYDATPNKDETYDAHLTKALTMSKSLMAAIKNYHNDTSKEEEQFPINNNYKITEAQLRKKISKDQIELAATKKLLKTYRTGTEKWRTIDNDWLEQAARLALYLDTYTNNSSLALAFELVKSGKVLLFAADAQTGNWNSWFNVKFKDSAVNADDLLSRTVMYKVGHHGSHNATLVAGLEKMKHDDLIAMIPVDKTDSNITKPNGWKMPATNLYKRLVEVTKNRVLRMEDTYGKGCNPVAEPAKSSWKKSGVKVKSDKLFVEVEIKG